MTRFLMKNKDKYKPENVWKKLCVLDFFWRSDFVRFILRRDDSFYQSKIWKVFVVHEMKKWFSYSSYMLQMFFLTYNNLWHLKTGVAFINRRFSTGVWYIFDDFMCVEVACRVESSIIKFLFNLFDF